jgi:hypothetical protein
MRTQIEQIAALRSVGFTELEARFLYLVATHSGYFTRRQFLAFTAKSKGWAAQHFTARLLRLAYARAVEYGRQTYVYNLYSRRLYDVIDKTNLRNRRRLSRLAVHVRLLILDFVLAHADECYLETEAKKVAYFRDHLGVPPSVFPTRIYRSRQSDLSATTRHFVDRFPIFLAGPDNPLSLPPVVTFTFCDTSQRDLFAYASHLRSYQRLLGRLPAFNFIYASADPSKFQRVATLFKRLFHHPREIDAHHLVHYFQLRLLWETHRCSMLTRADRDFLRAGDIRYRGEPFESTYRKWSTTGLSDTDIDALLGPLEIRQKRRFATYALPENYDIFFAEPRPVADREAQRQCSASGSTSRSVVTHG